MSIPPLDGLSARQIGYAVAAVRALGAEAETVCARFPQPPELARAARALAQERSLLPRVAAALDAPQPAELDRIPPSWYPAPPSPAGTPAADWLWRRAC